MDWTWYLFGFQGRINRAKYWLGGLVMLGWALFVAWIIFLPLHLVADGEPIPASLDFGTDTIRDFRPRNVSFAVAGRCHPHHRQRHRHARHHVDLCCHLD